VQFLFYLPASNLYGARVERPTASDWYRSIRPWAFGIKDLVTHRGGATILNNVINPTRGEITALRYTLPTSGMVTITVFTLNGDVVNVLQRGAQGPGEFTVTWDGRNRGGRVVARGVYFVRVVGPGIDETRKVLVVK